jgi:hypothetical protein
MNFQPASLSALALAFALNAQAAPPQSTAETPAINDQEYLAMTGLNVMLARDFYPEGRQGCVASGTALIRPDFPELLEWSFLWQQT